MKRDTIGDMLNNMSHRLRTLGTERVLHIERVIYSDPATIVYWSDGTRTVVRCQPGDTYDPKLGFLLALVKKSYGNTGAYNKVLRQWIIGYDQPKEELTHE